MCENERLGAAKKYQKRRGRKNREEPPFKPRQKRKQTYEADRTAKAECYAAKAART